MATSSEKTAIFVVGATAVGKTSIAIRLAQNFDSEIISADSRQCYRELNIGVARPSEAELGLVPHYFIASHSITENITAGFFERFALKVLDDLFVNHHQAIVTGGTGLYVDALTNGMDEIPDVPESIRAGILANYERFGLEWLQAEVKKADASFYDIGEIKNPQRLLRALEVKMATSKSILDFRKGKKQQREFNIISIGLELPKEILHQRINDRVDAMIISGLVVEVEKLLPYKNLNALQTVGYKEIFDYIEGKNSLNDAIELIKKNTRHYAKRQSTWFRKNKETRWFHPDQFDEICQYIRESLKKVE